MPELIDKWEVVNKLIQLENNYQFYKEQWDADVLYRRICELEIGIGKTPGVTVQEWIPVSEPPKKGGRYLVYDCDTGNYYDSYFDETEGEFGEWQNCFDPFTLGVIDCEWNSCPNVTHWMPLPQPPKGE